MNGINMRPRTGVPFTTHTHTHSQTHKSHVERVRRLNTLGEEVVSLAATSYFYSVALDIITIVIHTPSHSTVYLLFVVYYIVVLLQIRYLNNLLLFMCGGISPTGYSSLFPKHLTQMRYARYLAYQACANAWLTVNVSGSTH